MRQESIIGILKLPHSRHEKGGYQNPQSLQRMPLGGVAPGPGTRIHLHVCTGYGHTHTCTYMHLTHIYILVQQNHMFLFTVKLPLPSLTSDYPECYGVDMLGLKSYLIHEG